MKAQPVKKLDPEPAAGENAARIIEVRVDELMLVRAEGAGRDRVKAQHDMRIAAKRLRYVLEATGFCFGRPADTARRRARDLQDILGEMHDCDVMLPRVARAPERAAQPRTRRPCGHAPADARTSTRGSRRGLLIAPPTAGSTCSPST